jgi:hypothetical protein
MAQAHEAAELNGFSPKITMAPQRHLTWRIQNIPSHYSEADVLACFHSDDKKYVHIRSLAPDVSNYDGKGTLTATLLFSAPEKREPRVEEGGPGEDLILDKDFIGFTPLNSPSSDVCAE